MPELPDLTIFAESLQKVALNREISEVVYHKSQPDKLDVSALQAAMTGRKISAVKRVGKELLFELDNGNSVLIHLMLAGGFKLCGKKERVSFAVLTVAFQDGESLVAFDPKGLLKISLNPDLSERAVDALDVTSDYLAEVFKKKPKKLLKAVLIDQQVVAGIGNAYADEILYEAKISPKSTVGSIPLDAAVKLTSSIHSVLTQAVSHLRKHHAGMLSGEIRDFLVVHNPRVKAAPSGSPIIVEQVASKKTYYTKEQTLYVD
jgi:formamidopyrimidine-DNA glycosylase